MAESIILVHGKPGAGKSTCCRYAVEHASNWAGDIPVRHLSVGLHFRAIARGDIDSRYAREVRQIGNKVLGMALPPHELVQHVVEEFINQFDSPGITLVDGYPKEPELLPCISQAVADGRMHVAGCITVNVCDAEAVERQLSRSTVDGHPDYDAAVAHARVNDHNTTTEPVIAALASTYGSIEIIGEQSMGAMNAAFTWALGSLLLHAEQRLAS